MSGSAARTLAALHAEAFDAPWSPEAFADLLTQTGVAAEIDPHGFILIRVVADEAEILTLAVRPTARRAGLGLALVQRAAVAATTLGAERLFLEVADDNAAARALYARAGFAAAGRRKAYYARRDGPCVDALILTLNLSERLPRA